MGCNRSTKAITAATVIEFIPDLTHTPVLHISHKNHRYRGMWLNSLHRSRGGDTTGTAKSLGIKFCKRRPPPHSDLVELQKKSTKNCETLGIAN
jgi:hypothetical protein